MAAKKGLGKGLDNLIPNKVQETMSVMKNVSRETHQTPDRYVKLSKIEPREDQPRKEFDKAKLEELADSIKKHGVIQPLLVTDKGKYFELVAGERRWRAARMAGLSEVPVIVRDLTRQEIMEISLIENLQRDDLNAIEEAQAYKTLADEYGLKQTEIAKSVSKSRVAITNAMRLLKLPKEVQKLIEKDKLSAGHARAILALDSAQKQEQAAQIIVEKNLSVRDAEELVKKLPVKNPPQKQKKPAQADKHAAVYEKLEDELRERLGTDVRINRARGGKGKIEISYYSPEELERIYDLLT